MKGSVDASLICEFIGEVLAEIFRLLEECLN